MSSWAGLHLNIVVRVTAEGDSWKIFVHHVTSPLDKDGTWLIVCSHDSQLSTHHDSPQLQVRHVGTVVLSIDVHGTDIWVPGWQSQQQKNQELKRSHRPDFLQIPSHPQRTLQARHADEAMWEKLTFPLPPCGMEMQRRFINRAVTPRAFPSPTFTA